MIDDRISFELTFHYFLLSLQQATWNLVVLRHETNQYSSSPPPADVLYIIQYSTVCMVSSIFICMYVWIPAAVRYSNPASMVWLVWLVWWWHVSMYIYMYMYQYCMIHQSIPDIQYSMMVLTAGMMVLVLTGTYSTHIHVWICTYENSRLIVIKEWCHLSSIASLDYYSYRMIFVFIESNK